MNIRLISTTPNYCKFLRQIHIKSSLPFIRIDFQLIRTNHGELLYNISK